MPNLKFTPNLVSSEDVKRTLEYLVNPDHPNHEEYEVETHLTLMDGSPVDDFPEACQKATKRYNFTRPASEQVKTTGMWLIARFPDNSHLSRDEETGYEDVMANAFAPDRKCFKAWHRHIITGAADLNIASGTVTDEIIPSLRHHRDDPLIARLRRLSDRFVKNLNAARAASGDDRRIEEMPRYRSRNDASIVLRLADTARALKILPRMEHLGSLLSHSGFNDDSWSIDLYQNLHVQEGDKKKKCLIQIPVSDLLAAIEHFLVHDEKRLMRRKKKARYLTPSANDVKQPQTSSTAVLHSSPTAHQNQLEID